MTKQEMQELEFLIDKYENYLFKKYSRLNPKQTNAEYVHKNITEEIENNSWNTPQ